MRWQDGGAFTASDVVFSARRIKSAASLLRAVLASVKEVRKVDRLTVDVETNEIDPILPQEVTVWLIMSEAWATSNNAVEPADLASGVENYAVRHAMGTGPYALVLREPDRRTIVERNPNWWDKSTSNVDRAEFDVIANGATRVAALLSGDIDMVYTVPPQDIDRIKATSGFQVLILPELRTIFLGLNQWRDELPDSDVRGRNPLRDERVREAFALAIDEDAIVKHIMRGLARATWLMWAPGVNGFDAMQNIRPKPDLARARQLLAEAGYPSGFRLSMDCPNDRYVNDEAICTAIVAMLARIGVHVDLLAQTRLKFFSKIGPPAYDTDFFLIGYTPNTYDAREVIANFLLTRNPPAGELNYAGFSNPLVDELTARIATEIDSDRRLGMIRQVAGIVQKDFGYIPLHQQSLVWAARSNVELAQRPDNFLVLSLVRMK